MSAPLMRIRILTACMVFLGATTNAFAAVSESLLNTPYPVQDQTARPLWPVLLSATPIHDGGRAFLGNTNWRIRWHFHYALGPDRRCSILDVTTELTATITLPRLVTNDPARAREFVRIVTPLRTHEMGHYTIAQEAAAAIDKRIAALGPMGSCEVLEDAANRAGQSLLDAYSRKQLRYDQVTDHGRLQTAWQGQ